MIREDSVCPLEWRYGSEEMRKLFTARSIIEKFIEVEKAIFRGLAEAGFAPLHCLEVIEACSLGVDASSVYEREKAVHHDIAALSYILGEKCGECGRYIHLGATSYDIVDSAWSLIMREALGILKRKLRAVIEKLIHLSETYRDTLMVGRTHGQHALPITLGFKFANYVYEFARSYERICDAEKRVLRCKISGAVGTMAAWGEKGLVVEHAASKVLGLEPHLISTQVAPRDGIAEIIAILAILGSQLDRLALEVRELSRPEIGEILELRRGIGSSTMPHKSNPVTAERISGLAKVLRSFVVVALENIPLMHERDLTNSSSERMLIPHAFLVIDQMLEDTLRLLDRLHIDIGAMKRNLDLTRGAIMAEAVMVELVKRGVPRHVAHSKLIEVVRSMSSGESFRDALLRDEFVSKFFTKEELDEILRYDRYLGSYRALIERAIKYAKQVIAKC